MQFLTFVLAFFAVLGVALGDGIQFSRTVNAIAPDTDFILKFDSGCSATDAHGSNKCSFAWGQQVSGSVEGHLGHDLEAGSTVSVNMKVNKVIPFAFNCPACGANCTFTIPVVNQPVNTAMPPCPIAASEVANTLFSQALPATSPTKGVKATATGTFAVVDHKQATVLNLSLDATIQ